MNVAETSNATNDLIIHLHEQCWDNTTMLEWCVYNSRSWMNECLPNDLNLIERQMRYISHLSQVQRLIHPMMIHRSKAASSCNPGTLRRCLVSSIYYKLHQSPSPSLSSRSMILSKASSLDSLFPLPVEWHVSLRSMRGARTENESKRSSQ